MTTISITIKGIPELVKDYGAFRKDMQNMSEPLTISSKKYLNVVHTNFTDNGATFGQSWPKLKDVTIAEKRMLYKQGKSIGVTKPLLRTGLLRKSFDYLLQGKKNAMVFNAQDYAQIHQEGGITTYKGRSVKIPKRILADVDTKRIDMVGRVFVSWVKKLVKQHKM